MGWGARFLACAVALIALLVGLWPIAILSLGYFVLTFRRPKGQRAIILKQQVLPNPRQPWGRYAAAAFFGILGATAVAEGGTLSPILFLGCGVAVLTFTPLRTRPFVRGIFPVDSSILLRSKLFPLLWCSLVEVKVESQEQVRGIAALEGNLLFFAGKAPSTFKVTSVYAVSFRQAEEKILRRLRKDSKSLSARGVHLLPLDSHDAQARLSLVLGSLEVGAEAIVDASVLAFDLLSLGVKDGLVVSHRAFRIVEPSSSAWVPPSDDSSGRRPLLAEIMEEVREEYAPLSQDVLTSFLASMDASRTEPVVDRIKTKGGDEDTLMVETPSGLEVRLTRAQLRAIVRMYA